MFFSACKTYNYEALKYSSDKNIPIDKPLKIVIEKEEITEAYKLNIIYVNTYGGAGAVQTNERKELVEESIKNIKSFANKFEANKEEKPHAFLRITINDYEEKANIMYSALNGFFIMTPMLFGCPIMTGKSKIKLVAGLYDNNKKLIKEYDIIGKGKVRVGGYGAYKSKSASKVMNIKGVNNALSKLEDSLINDAALINEKLSNAKPITSSFLGRFEKTDDDDSDGVKNSIKGGTGFVISETGYVVTNFHVINKSNKIELSFNIDSSFVTYDAKVVATDQANDIAILKIDDNKFTGFDKVPYVLSDDYSVGEKVFTIGYPQPELMGTDFKYTSGEINSLTGIENNVSMMQISAPIQPGNSGGPLFNEKGDVVGITTSTLNPFYTAKYGNSIPQNVNYAVKSDYVKPIVKQYIDKTTNQIAEKSTKEKVAILNRYTCLIRIY